MQVKRSRNEKEIKNGYERQKEHDLVFDLNGGMPQMAQALPLATLLQVFPIRMKGMACRSEPDFRSSGRRSGMGERKVQ